MASDVFEPVRMVLVDTGHGPGVAVEDAEGQHTGILIPESTRAILSEFLETSGPKFLEMWRDYELGRGGEVFLWDLVHLATFIASLPNTRWARRLARIRSGGELYHNAVQAQLMAVAETLHPGSIRLERPAPPERRPDFSVACPVETAFEVESISKAFCLQLVDDGVRLAPADARRLVQSIIKRATKGFTQVGARGTVVVAVWCDHLAALVDASPPWAEREAAIEASIAPNQLVICTRPAQGQLRAFAFARHDWQSKIAELGRSLSFATAPHAFSLSAGMSFAKSTRPISIGRHLCINNSEGSYTDEEFATVMFAPAIAQLSAEDLSSFAATAESCRVQLELAAASIQQAPLESRKYEIRELFGDQRIRDLVSSATWLSVVSEHMSISQADKEDAERLEDDIQRFVPIAKLFRDALDRPTETPTAVAALLSSRKPFNLARRIASLYCMVAKRESERRERSSQ